MRQLFRPAACLLVIGVLCTPISGEVIEQVLVKVNGDIITKSELEARQIAALRQRIGKDIEPEAVQNDEQLKKMLAEITPIILVDAIDELLIVQLAKERGYKLRDEQFSEWLTNLRKEQKLEEDDRFKAALKQEGMTLDDLRKNVEREFMKSQVQRDEIGSKLSITEEEARQYYLVHPDEFTDPANVTLREILIEAPSATKGGQSVFSVAEDDQARATAAAVRSRLLAGEDFAKVAAEVSAAPSKANGGLIGPVVMSELSESLQTLVKGMKPGEVTPPIRTTRGFQILKLETLKESAVQPFDSVRDLVAERVSNDRQRQEMRKFLTRMRSQAIIEWKNAELKKAYDQVIDQALPGN